MSIFGYSNWTHQWEYRGSALQQLSAFGAQDMYLTTVINQRLGSLGTSTSTDLESVKQHPTTYALQYVTEQPKKSIEIPDQPAQSEEQ